MKWVPGHAVAQESRPLWCSPGMAWALLALAPQAAAHEFEIHVLDPSDDWCAELHRVAAPADVVQLGPGTYRGGCELSLGGEPEKNEALLIQGALDGTTVIEADADGLSLRITGEPTRLYQLDVRGRVEVAAEGATIDTSIVRCLQVDAGIAKVTVLFSELGALDLDVDDTVVRGNQLGSAQITARTGLVADNVVHGDLHSTLPTHRNLVLGDLLVEGDAFGNIVVGATDAVRLAGNTLLGPVTAADASNNLTTEAELDATQGNLRCSDCLVDAEGLDVQPIGAALTAPLVPSSETILGFCTQPQAFVGAVGPVGDGWTAFDRDRLGCLPGLQDGVPHAPEPAECAPEVPDTAELTLEPSNGCSTSPSPSGLAWLSLFLLTTRRTR